jgi:hypothetical protein
VGEKFREVAIVGPQSSGVTARCGGGLLGARGLTQAYHRKAGCCKKATHGSRLWEDDRYRLRAYHMRNAFAIWPVAGGDASVVANGRAVLRQSATGATEQEFNADAADLRSNPAKVFAVICGIVVHICGICVELFRLE